MENNAEKVYDEVSERIDGAPTIDGSRKSYVSKHSPHFVFWDTSFLRAYLKAIEEKRKDMQGFNFSSSLKLFADQHMQKG